MTASFTLRSWRDRIREADPEFETDKERREPVVYEFSNGRKFRDKRNPYAGTST